MDTVALELAGITLDEATATLIASGSLPPLLVVQKNGARISEHLPPVPPEQATMAARIYAAARSESDATAFAVMSSIEFHGAQFDGIVVESWNFGSGKGARIGLRYERGTSGALHAIGGALHIGPEGWFEPARSVPASTGADSLLSQPLATHVLLLALSDLMTSGSPVTPFALVQTDGRRERFDMTAELIEDAVASVHAYALTRGDADFVAYVIDGVVPLDGKRSNALIIEAWHFASALSFRVAQPYGFIAGRKEPGVVGRAVTQLNDGSWVPASRLELGGEVLFGS